MACGPFTMNDSAFRSNAVRQRSSATLSARISFQNEIGVLRMKGERLLPADIPRGFDGAKVALYQGRSCWQAHSDQDDLGCRWEARCAG
jgi:hypothetical protein